MLKKLTLVLTFLVLFALPSSVMAAEADQTVVCPEPYGGGVVCGVHTPVDTGIGDNLPEVGAGLVLASGVFYFLSRKFRFNA